MVRILGCSRYNKTGANQFDLHLDFLA